MAALDNFLNRAKSVAQNTGKKASELLEATKLNLSISELQIEIDNVMKEIGKTVYHDYENQMVTNEEIAQKCAKIEEKYAQIKDLKDKVNSIKNLKICSKCAEANPSSNAFCLKCGNKLEEEASTQTNVHGAGENYVEADMDKIQKTE